MSGTARDRLPLLEPIPPDHLRTAPTDVVAVWRQADGLLSAAETAAAAGDLGTVLSSHAQSETLLQHVGALLTLAGAQCGDPARAANAALNIPLRDVHHVATGFGSVWVSPWFGTAIHRVDPASGDLLATIDVGASARRLQPADGRMIVRTTDAYVAIDPATNSVSDPSQVRRRPVRRPGPAVDGGCGSATASASTATTRPRSSPAHRHRARYDCGHVYATTELVVAFSYNEDPGESGTSAAAFIDPTTNQLLATSACLPTSPCRSCWTTPSSSPVSAAIATSWSTDPLGR